MINARELLDLADEIDGLMEEEDELQLPIDDEESDLLVKLYNAGEDGLPYDDAYEPMIGYQWVEAINGNYIRVTPKGIRHAENTMVGNGIKFNIYQF